MDENREEDFIVKVDDALQNALDSDLPGSDEQIRQCCKPTDDDLEDSKTSESSERNSSENKKVSEYRPADSTVEEKQDLEGREMNTAEDSKDKETRLVLRSIAYRKYNTFHFKEIAVSVNNFALVENCS